MNRPEPFEVRGVSPEGRLDIAPRQLARAHFTVDPATGTVTWTPVAKRGDPLVLRLPGRGDPALPELHKVVVMTSLTNAEGDVRLLVLVDGGGRALATTPPVQTVNFDKVWTPALLDPLRPVGVEVVTEAVPSQRYLQRRYPGAARYWMLTTPGWILLPVAGTALVLFAAFAVFLLIVTA